MFRDEEPALYLYRQIMDGHAQIGVVGCAPQPGAGLEPAHQVLLDEDLVGAAADDFQGFHGVSGLGFQKSRGRLA